MRNVVQRIPKPCVVGSNPTGGADALGLLGNGPAVGHRRGILSNRRDWLTRSGGAAAVPGDTSVRSSVSTEIPDSVYGTSSPRLSPPLSTR